MEDPDPAADKEPAGPVTDNPQHGGDDGCTVISGVVVPTHEASSPNQQAASHPSKMRSASVADSEDAASSASILGPDVPTQPNSGEKLQTNGLCSSADVVRETDTVVQGDVDSGTMQSLELNPAPELTVEILPEVVELSTSAATLSNSEDEEPVQHKTINGIIHDTALTSKTGGGPVVQACSAGLEISGPAWQSGPLEHPIQNTDTFKFTEDAGNVDVSENDVKNPSNCVVSAEEKRVNIPNARSISLETTLAELTAERMTLIQTLAALPSVAVSLPQPLTRTLKSYHSSATNENGAAEAPDSPEACDSGKDGRTDPNVFNEEAVMTAARTITKRHISLLHTYNEIRDIGQGLMGLIADSRGVRIKDVQEEFGIDAKD